MQWVSKAECKNLTHLFYPPDNERPPAANRREAIAYSICSQCKVIEQCKDYARTNGEIGYWAGENEFDRHLLGFTLKTPYWAFTRALYAYSKRKHVRYKN